MDSITRSQDKLFSLIKNYLKGEGDEFHSHVEECHPDIFLIPVPSLKGNLQDVVMQCDSATCVNRPHHDECLDKRLWACKKNNVLE